MKNIFNKTNAPYLASGALAIGTLLASGIFAVAPYIGFLAPVAALSLGLPFVIGGAVFSAAAIALSAVVINKNKTISEKDAVVQAQEQEISEQKARLAKNNTKLFDKQEQLPKEEVKLDNLDLAASSKQGKQANSLDYLNIDNVSKQFDLSSIDAAKKHLMSLVEKDINEDIFFDAEPGEEKNTENPSPENQPVKDAAPCIPTLLNGAKPSPFTNSTMHLS
ncbi:MAG: hypothetical protein LBJ80_03800 [Rickettsiales bacterium]|jgi:hypothetical protein|nr:hypothetical protein [Rickettsiales bacterium]MDR1261513.1 hypothetical protein [Rickettsiales bacterium]